MRKWMAFLLSLALGASAVFLLGRLTRPKYASGLVKEGGMIETYYAHAGEGHQVIFLGDCEVYESFSPVTLFNEFGVSSYVRGSAQQLMWQSYYLLRETFRYETPRAVVLSICSLRYDEPQSEAYNRMTLDGMRLSVDKAQAVHDSLTEGESALSYYVPLLRYHSRIFSLTGEDVRYWLSGPELTFDGYLMRCEAVPYTRLPAAPLLQEASFGERPMAYLDQIVALCEEKDVALVLVKSPCLYPAWYEEWDEWLAAYAQQKGVAYINAIPSMDEMGIDLSADTYDGGMHLNVYGVEKYTRWFGRQLTGILSLTDERTDPATAARYEQLTARYEAEKKKQREAINE